MAEKSTAVDPAEWDAWKSFISMRQHLDTALERQLQRDAEISTAEYAVLMSLFESPAKQLRAGELGRALAWEKSRVSHQVSRMEKRGLVERRTCDSDARGTWIGITPEGSRAALRATREHGHTLRSLFFDLVSPDELATLRAVFDRVQGAAEPVACEGQGAD